MLDDKEENAIIVKGVSKNFKTGDSVVHALKDVNFIAKKGEMLMIVGPSGCGKTTLLSVIAGTLKFESGEVEVFNHFLHEMKEGAITEFRKKNVGFVFQQYHLIKTLDLLENISIPLILNGHSRSFAFEKADEMLEKVGLKGRGKERPLNLSGGQQQRVAIARALVHEPPLLICDEPTAALDAESGARILELLREVARTPDRCVIVVTHDSRIFHYADRLAAMDDGSVVKIDSNHKNSKHL
ncbi:MAG: ABC transporter ATP-binding protein [Candidatus Protochlamydia sp.]|nr:ABC transporter ATP-binding protein [Candidatus Protochlamydia sp.]